MDTRNFAYRHIGISEADLPEMLKVVGVDSVDALMHKVYPEGIFLEKPLDLPEPMTERELSEHLFELGSRNRIFTSYIGMGWYDTVTPQPIIRNVLENPVWYTSYTPYQAEVSQGRLEALFNFQTVITDLTGLPLTNCSLLDEATAGAEAALMLYNERSREQKKAGANQLFIDKRVFASTQAVIQTRVPQQGMEIVVGDYETFDFTDKVFGAIIQYPDEKGSIHCYHDFMERTKAAGVRVAVAADLMSLVLLTPPGEWGADIVIHSTSKYMDGHAVQVGGVIVDSGKFDWTGGKFPCMTEPDESYHGTIYTEKYSFAPYIVKARMQLMRDFGCYPAANSSFLLNLGLETLPVRMKQYCENALTVAKFLESNDKVESVAYPGLESDKYHKLAEKYLPLGTAGVISFVIKGGRDTAAKFMDSLKLASNEVHVADIRTCILHPASATHRQLSDEQLVAAGINGGMIRLSVGLENVEDIIDDLKQGFAAI